MGKYNLLYNYYLAYMIFNIYIFMSILQAQPDCDNEDDQGIVISLSL